MSNFNEAQPDSRILEIFHSNQYDDLMTTIKCNLNSLAFLDQRIDYAQDVLEEINLKLDPSALKNNPLKEEQIKILNSTKEFLRDEIIFLNINLQTIYMRLFVEEF